MICCREKRMSRVALGKALQTSDLFLTHLKPSNFPKTYLSLAKLPKVSLLCAHYFFSFVLNSKQYFNYRPDCTQFIAIIIMRFGPAAVFFVAFPLLFDRAVAGDGSGEAKIGPGVREELEDAPSSGSEGGPAGVEVIITLEENYEGTCAELYPEIDVYYEYSFHACAGIINTTEVLDNIASNPLTTYIELDELEELYGFEAAAVNAVNARKLLGTSVPLVGADTRHSLGNAGAGVTVAVIDSGIVGSHPNFPPGTIVEEACFSRGYASATWFGGQCLDRWGFIGELEATGPGAAEEPWPGSAHGTHVAGIIASRGIVGDVGMAPAANIVAIRVCFDQGCALSDILAGMDYVLGLDVDIVNLSLGGGGFASTCDRLEPAYFNAVNALLDDDILTIAAAGNNGQPNGRGSFTSISAPACLSNVVAVGMSDNMDNRNVFGDSNSLVDLFAPGTDIESSVFFGAVEKMTGTSMASP